MLKIPYIFLSKSFMTIGAKTEQLENCNQLTYYQPYYFSIGSYNMSKLQYVEATILYVKATICRSYNISKLSTICRSYNMSKLQYVEATICQSYSMSKLQYVEATICHSYIMSKLQYVEATVFRSYSMWNTTLLG